MCKGLLQNIISTNWVSTKIKKKMNRGNIGKVRYCEACNSNNLNVVFLSDTNLVLC